MTQVTRFTELKPRAARAAILILIQHNLAWHTQSDEDGEIVEFNAEECLMRLRFGKFVWQAEQLFGPAVSNLVSWARNLRIDALIGFRNCIFGA